MSATTGGIRPTRAYRPAIGLSDDTDAQYLAALALQRWETEGGALFDLAPPWQPHIHADNSTDQ